ncbi:MAG: hypothetical protein ACREN2_10980 [Candidatus Dormibacteria bacterium]
MSVAIIVRHRVQNYEAWRPLFEEHGTVRRQYGGLGHQIDRVEGDPNDLVIVLTFRDLEGARGFVADPSLAETMQHAGVISKPEIWFSDQVEVVEYPVAVG